MKLWVPLIRLEIIGYLQWNQRTKNLYKINDKSGAISRGYKVPAEYTTRCVDGFIAYDDPVRIYDPSGNPIYTFNSSNVKGIPSGLTKLDDYWIISIMDGAKPCIASTKGWVLLGQYPEVIALNGQLYGFAKSGAVQIINPNDGKIEKTIGNTYTKPQRARIKNNLIYWSTANWDQLWVTNGKDMKRLHEWKDGDSGDGTNSGSLFDTTITINGSNVIFGRSVKNKGFEIYSVKI